MGSYGVDQVLADPMIQEFSAMMLAANDPVGAWGAMNEGSGLATGLSLDLQLTMMLVLLQSKLTSVPSINARKEPKRLADVVLEALKEHM